MNLYNISNPAPTITPLNVFTPVCQTSPLCSSPACDTSKPITERVKWLVSQLTVTEKIDNLVDGASGSARIGLPPYEWWSEALHGVASSPGVTFTGPNGTAFSYATSFPMPITISAAFDDNLVSQVAAVVGREGRAFANHGLSGFDFWTPNMNGFKDPRWGRGPETPGEDAFRIQQYIRHLIPALQGSDPLDKQIIATCKHYAVYDVETGRYEYDYDPQPHDLAEYYLAPFKTCVRDVNIGSIMCSYNAVDGIPSCASQYLLQDILRDHWNFTAPYQYVVSDCEAVRYINSPHNFTDSPAAAAAVALNAGTDLECGSTYLNLNTSLASNMTTEAALDKALTRLYTALHTVGFFDGSSKYGSLGWSIVGTGDAQTLAYQAAVDGTVLLKNTDGLLPLDSKKVRKVAVIGPWANATSQMQGNYFGQAAYLVSPLTGLQRVFGADNVVYANGTDIAGNSTAGFAAALAAAKSADAVIFLGGIDNSIESESLDRTSISWPGNQLDLVSQLASVGKPLVVVQCGGGQLDDSALLSNPHVGALLWAGYPGQDGGAAIADILAGKQSPAGRLPVTQYAASYTSEVSLIDPALRPRGNSPGGKPGCGKGKGKGKTTTPSDNTPTFPGRTYKWYSGKPVLPFGHGTHYTTFRTAWASSPHGKTLAIASLFSSPAALTNADTTPAFTVSVSVTNTGKTFTSDFVGLLFARTSNAGPAPYPNKWLVGYGRLRGVAPGKTQTLDLEVAVGSLARVDEEGNSAVYAGEYELSFDVDGVLAPVKFTLAGGSRTVDTLPKRAGSYGFSVPVHTEPATFRG